MKHKKIILLSIMLGLILVPSLALSQGVQSIDPFAGTVQRGTDIIGAIRNIVNLLLTLVAIITVIFIIIGGVRYIVSQGDEEATNKAKRTILYAILGLIIILISGVLVNFILRAVSAVSN